MSHYIIWYTDVGIDKHGKEGEYEDYTVVEAKGITSAWQMAREMFGDYVIDVNPYTP